MNNELTIKPVAPIKTAGIIFLAVASLFLLVKTMTAWRDSASIDATNMPKITVSGTGEAFAVPTAASFTFTTTGQGSSVKEAQDKATALNNKQIATLWIRIFPPGER